jgi:hypothetical protein
VPIVGPRHLVAMHPFHDTDTDTDTETIAHVSCYPLTPIPTHGPSDVFVVKTLAAGGTVSYRVHCAPDATLAVLRDTLQNEDDKVMSADDRFHQGDFRVGKSAEPHIKWKDILQVRVVLQ